MYCASSIGTHPAYEHSAKCKFHPSFHVCSHCNSIPVALGAALAKASRPLIYGGGKMGLMGVVSQATLDNGGHVTGISPYAMVARGGEGSKTVAANTSGFEDKVSNREPPPHPNRVSVVVDSMHDRKMELAKRADGGFVALPGGYGTFEEVSTRKFDGINDLDEFLQLLEVTTWSQLAIHVKRELSRAIFYQY